MMSLRVFAVSGYSGTGKTSLIERLVQALKHRGYSVGVVKSSKEDVSPPEGTDTFRHLKATASPVILLGPSTTTIRYQRRLESIELLSAIEADFVLLEGFKSIALPRVLCIGDQRLDKSKIPEGTYAIIAWDKTELDEQIHLPVLQSDETDRIVSLVEASAMKYEHIRF
ncbi:molybdopterin-guanine dinucleotide biosynthesis protein B [Candidatus Thorarchaeota archaeon]|nr:MAG: molybdopterin-guanine dinucleotide biosynthesis protein B [Candidatus Thorarchaeota archaeon]